MAKVLLRAGAEVDFLTDEEMKKHTEHLANRFEAIVRGEEEETFTRACEPIAVTNSGGGAPFQDNNGVLYRVPVGYDAYLTRLAVALTTRYFSTPPGTVLAFTSVYADEINPANMRIPIKTASMPVLYEASRSHAPLFRGGQRIILRVQRIVVAATLPQMIFPNIQVLLTKRKAIRHDTLDPEA